MNYDVRGIQKVMLGILKAADEAIRSHGLRYYLEGGTMLGAVRHHGFIPWDDDADIAMPRPDYEKFIREANDWLPPYYRLRCHLNDPDYPFYFAKIEDTRTTIVEGPTRPYVGGVFVDVFPIDAQPENLMLRRKRYKRFRRLCKRLHFLHRDPYKHGKGPRSWYPLLLRKLYTRAATSEAIAEIHSDIDFDKEYEVGIMSPNYQSYIPRQAVYGKGKEIEFEGLKLIVPEHPEIYLRKQYGDFMQLPPVEKRYCHNFLKVDLENSYLAGSRGK